MSEGLVAALARAQAKFPPVGKNQENRHFGSKYADLAAVLDAVRPTLAAEGIALVQLVSENEHGTTLVTKLLRGDESLESVMPLAIDGLTSQQIGSVLTYSRRYAALAICGVHPEDDDDDGNAAETAAPARTSGRSGASGAKPASDAQVNFARRLLDEVIAPTLQLAVIAEHARRLDSVDDLATLTGPEISPLIEWLKREKKAGRTAEDFAPGDGTEPFDAAPPGEGAAPGASASTDAAPEPRSTT